MDLADLMTEILGDACGQESPDDQPDHVGQYRIDLHCVAYTIRAVPPRLSESGQWDVKSYTKEDN